MQRYRSWILPIAILLGIFFHQYITELQSILPFLIFLMLFFSFNTVRLKEMHFGKFDLWLLLFQIVVAPLFYLLLKPFNPIIAQGIFVTVLAPTAAAAIAVAVMLGANVATMTTYLIACNLLVAVAAPLSFTLIGANPDISFWSSFLTILAKVFPLLIVPFLLAIFLQFCWPKANQVIVKYKNASFYIWAVSLTIVVSRAIGLMIQQYNTHREMFLWMVALSIALCVLQFFVGKRIGRHYGCEIAGGQALGQKNTVLAIWMSQSYLNPLSSIFPVLYVIWQNIFNSYQLFRKDRRDAQKTVSKTQETC